MCMTYYCETRLKDFRVMPLVFDNFKRIYREKKVWS